MASGCAARPPCATETKSRLAPADLWLSWATMPPSTWNQVLELIRSPRPSSSLPILWGRKLVLHRINPRLLHSRKSLAGARGRPTSILPGSPLVASGNESLCATFWPGYNWKRSFPLLSDTSHFRVAEWRAWSNKTSLQDLARPTSEHWTLLNYCEEPEI